MTSPLRDLDALPSAAQTSLTAVGLTDFDLNVLNKAISELYGDLRIVTAFSEAQRHLAGFSGELVICSRRFAGGDWQSLMKECRKLYRAPSLIVASTAEEKMNHFWLEALNGGAFDVISYPFSVDDVRRTVVQASHDWRVRFAVRLRPKIVASERMPRLVRRLA